MDDIGSVKPQFVEVTNAGFQDHPDFIPDTEESITQTFAEFGKTYDIDHHLAYEGKKMVGICSVYNDSKKKSNRFVQLCVRPEYRHKGIGSALITGGITELAAQGSELMKLNVSGKNAEYVRFPQKFGFKENRDMTAMIFTVK